MKYPKILDNNIQISTNQEAIDSMIDALGENDIENELDSNRNLFSEDFFPFDSFDNISSQQLSHVQPNDFFDGQNEMNDTEDDDISEYFNEL